MSEIICRDHKRIQRQNKEEEVELEILEVEGKKNSRRWKVGDRTHCGGSETLDLGTLAADGVRMENTTSLSTLPYSTSATTAECYI
jgi:hypothetical protein